MKKIVKNNYLEMSLYVTNKIIKKIIDNPQAVICIAGGETPTGIYSLLPQKLHELEVDYSKITFISLDEWVGLDKKIKGSCIETLYSKLYDNLELTENQIVFFDGTAQNLEEECRKMDKIITKLGGLDLIVLGIGLNGHIGFNEPGVDDKLRTHVVPLEKTTKKVMNKYFDTSLNLTHGITLGMQDIYQTGEIYIIANGENKKNIVDKFIHNSKSNKYPITLLKDLENVELVIDSAADEEKDEKNNN